jgi:peptidoglycan/LPS O-acetylase OafA/YrhL
MAAGLQEVSNGARSQLRADNASVAPRANLNAITGVRFLAAAGVVLYHFALPIVKPRSSLLSNVIGAGYTAVELFFHLSRVNLSYSYFRSDGSMRGSRRNFFVSRFARIYPAYLVGFLLAAPSDIATSLHVNRMATAIEKLLINGGVVLAMVQAWTPFTAWSWNFPAWSVSVEAFFYILFPVVGLQLARLAPCSARITAGLLWLASLAAPFLLWRMHGITGPPSLGDHLQMAVEFTPILRLPEFLLGILLGQAFLRGAFQKLNGTLAVFLACGSLFALLGFCPSVPHPLLANGLLAPLFALLIVGLAKGGGPISSFLSLPIMVVLGEASYSLYILQIPVALALRIPPPYSSARILLFYLAALLICSLLTWRFIETPVRRIIRARLSSPERPRGEEGPVALPLSPARHAASEW